MRLPYRLTLCALLLASPLFASAAPASDSEINRLLSASRAQTMLTNLLPKLEAMQDQQFNQALSNPALTPEQRQRIEDIAQRTREVMRQNMAWPQLRKIYLEQYRQHFSREDILAMAEFYESDTGQRMLDRNPELMAGTIGGIQAQLAPQLDALRRELEALAQPAR